MPSSFFPTGEEQNPWTTTRPPTMFASARDSRCGVADSKSLSWIIQNIGLLALSYESLKCSVFHGPTPAVWPKGGTRQATSSPAGAKPGNTGNHVDTRVGYKSAMCSPANVFLLANLKMDSR